MNVLRTSLQKRSALAAPEIAFRGQGALRCRVTNARSQVFATNKLSGTLPARGRSPRAR